MFDNKCMLYSQYLLKPETGIPFSQTLLLRHNAEEYDPRGWKFLCQDRGGSDEALKGVV